MTEEKNQERMSKELYDQYCTQLKEYLDELEHKQSWRYIITHKILPAFICGAITWWIIFHLVLGLY